MKKDLLTIITCISLFAGALTLPVVTTGCKTSQQKLAVNTLFTVGKTVDATYKAYLDLVISGKLATNNVPRVSADYRTFQQVYSTGIEFVAGNTNAAAPQMVLDAAKAFSNTVDAAKKGAL